ncbi:hypothetical Protein YC6258_05734 [Gynuella sunshinyii YC6258]|uniref:Uncharacterized protein n=1 Tax=Gynuella sunshinyii YC6258 TaxID=1445510 RepID=A0A0C5VSY3_9GAMM|nr:hypothetical Protein YC6258_05734 [Gynuella sunshinyii YC6258]
MISYQWLAEMVSMIFIVIKKERSYDRPGKNINSQPRLL